MGTGDNVINQCSECGLHYEDNEVAMKCQKWCKENHSCNLELTRLSVEVKQFKAQNHSGAA